MHARAGRWRSGWLALAGLLLVVACARAPGLPRLAPGDVVLAFGDSLTAGVGAAAGQDYPARLADMIGRRVVNAGVPGETTGEGLQRLDSQLDAYGPRLLLLCLGGNDMLRHQAAEATAANLRAMVRLARERGVAVVLIGVPQPSLFGAAPAFYAEIAKEFGLVYEDEAFVAVLHDRELKSDLIHANAAGYREVARRLAARLREAGAV